jgi:hypothetical protein
MDFRSYLRLGRRHGTVEPEEQQIFLGQGVVREVY